MDRLVKYGDRGEWVSFLQTHLNSLNYQLEVDGIFGKDTLRAVNAYQESVGLDKSTVINVSKLECNLRLERECLEERTLGKLYINNEFFCDTIEDKYRDLSKEKKVYGETCIPFGTYKVIINMSPKYGRLMPRLLDVPHFEGILIHSGNTEQDSAGCIICGKRSGQKVINSRDTFNRLFNRLEKYSIIKIEIV